jgi:hypothetical protein
MSPIGTGHGANRCSLEPAEVEPPLEMVVSGASLYRRYHITPGATIAQFRGLNGPSPTNRRCTLTAGQCLQGRIPT